MILDAVVFGMEMAHSSSNRRKLMSCIGSKGLLDLSLIFKRIRSHGCGIYYGLKFKVVPGFLAGLCTVLAVT
jgi:hypothetical protein